MHTRRVRGVTGARGWVAFLDESSVHVKGGSPAFIRLLDLVHLG